MADNFNLRAFLTENKLTKNAQLLKEEQEDYQYFDEEGVGGFYMTTIDGVKIYSLEDSSVADTCFYALVEPETTYMISIDVSGEPISPPEILKQHQLPFEIAQFIADDIDRELGQEGDLNEDAETGGAYALVIDEDGYFMQEDLTTYAEESYLDPEGEQLQGVQQVSNYPSDVDAWYHAPKQEQSQNEEWKAAVARLGNSYTYYDVIADGGENAVIAAIPQGSNLSDYIKDEEDLDEVAPASMQAGFDMVSQEKRKHAEMMRVANKLFPEFGGKLENFKPLSSQQREMVYQNLDPANLKETIKEAMTTKEAQHLKKGDIITSGDEIISVSAGAKTPAGKVEVTMKTKSGKTKMSIWGKSTKIGVKTKETVNEAKLTIRELAKLKPGSKVTYLGKDVDGFKNGEQYEVSRAESSSTLQPTITIKNNDGKKLKTSNLSKTKETVKENKMTQRDKYLTRLVENALGIGLAEEDNVDYTMGRQDDPNQLPNPAPELNIPEGGEMADETVIPEYRTIDELMKSIDDGTNKVAEEHKMQEMKKIAQMLREKAKKMEESEHAAHISPKDLKQLATDAAKLEKAAEKLKAAFDKKFNKKEKPAAAPKAEKVEALQEGFFDLRKFLIENKLTAGSRMLNENADIQQAFSEAGLTGMVTVLFQSDSSMGEPNIAAMPAERALKLVAKKAANAESVIVVQANEITQGEQIGDYEEETEGLTCKLIVEILDEGAYEIWQ